MSFATKEEALFDVLPAATDETHFPMTFDPKDQGYWVYTHTGVFLGGVHRKSDGTYSADSLIGKKVRPCCYFDESIDYSQIDLVDAFGFLTGENWVRGFLKPLEDGFFVTREQWQEHRSAAVQFTKDAGEGMPASFEVPLATTDGRRGHETELVNLLGSEATNASTD